MVWGAGDGGGKVSGEPAAGPEMSSPATPNIAAAPRHHVSFVAKDFTGSCAFDAARRRPCHTGIAPLLATACPRNGCNSPRNHPIAAPKDISPIPMPRFPAIAHWGLISTLWAIDKNQL